MNIARELVVIGILFYLLLCVRNGSFVVKEFATLLRTISLFINERRQRGYKDIEDENS